MGLLSAAVFSGAARVGNLAYRGAFDQYARYEPGHLVLDGGAAYLNIAPVGADPELEDTFQRPDQLGWGQSSHGEYWQTSAGWRNDGPPSISDGRGVVRTSADRHDDGQLLGPGTLRGDSELLVRVALPVPASGAHHALWLGLNTTEDSQSFALAQVTVADDGTTQVQVQAELDPHGPENGAGAAGPTIADGQECWVRLRRVGMEYSLTAWAAGDTEPATPQDTLTATYAQPAGHVVVGPLDNVAGGLYVVRYLSLRPLTAATAPGDDDAHWTPLATALPVPTPL